MNNAILKIAEQFSNAPLKNDQVFHVRLFGKIYRISGIDSRIRQEMFQEYAHFAEYIDGIIDSEPDLSIDIIHLRLGDDIKGVLNEGKQIDVHQSESKQMKYLLDGSMLKPDDSIRRARLTILENGKNLYYFEKTGNAALYDSKNKRIWISGDRVFVEIKDIIETTSIYWLETNDNLMVHSSCCTTEEGEGILIAGHSGRGKTTLMMNLIYFSNCSFVSNDRVYIHMDQQLETRGAPIQLNIGLGTFKNFPDLVRYIPDSIKGHFTNNLNDMNSYKVRFEPYQFNLLFQDQIKSTCFLKRIMIPDLDLESNSEMEEISEDEGLNILKNCLLSPHDENHPKWLMNRAGLDEKIQMNIKTFDDISRQKLSFSKVRIGNDAKQFFKDLF